MIKPEILYLEIDDEITSVAEKVRATESVDVIVVVPKNAILLQSIVNLKLLAKSASKIHKRLAVVTADKSARNIVFRAGLPLMARVSDPFPENVPTPSMPTSSDEISVAREGESDNATERAEQIGDKKITVKTYSAQDEEDDSKKSESPTSPVRKILVARPVPHIPLIKEKETPPSSSRLEKIREIQSRRATGKSRIPKSVVTVIAAFVGFAVLVSIGVLYFVLPKATVVLTPKTEPASAKVNVTVITGTANPVLGELAGSFLEVTKQESKSFPATGQKDFGKKAAGTVNFSNSYSSATQVFAKGTKLQTTNGLTYVLDASVTIPGATVSGGSTVPGTISGTATAEKTGDTYNIGSHDIIIVGLASDKVSKITASTTGFSGGTQDVKKVVAQSDVDAAKKSFEEQVKADSLTDLKGKVASGSLLVDGASATVITESKSSVAVGDAADNFDLSVTAKASGMSFVDAEMKQLSAQQLATKLAGEKNLVGSDAGTFSYSVSTFDAAAKRMVVSTTVSKTVVPAMDLDSYKAKVAGKSETEVRDYFAPLSEISSVRVVFWPFYVGKVPKDPSRIEIQLDTK